MKEHVNVNNKYVVVGPFEILKALVILIIFGPTHSLHGTNTTFSFSVCFLGLSAAAAARPPLIIVVYVLMLALKRI